MFAKIPIEELRRTEAKCNSLLAIEEDYQHVLRSLEQRYATRIRERRLRKIVGGAAGPEEVLLEEEPSPELYQYGGTS
jgi:hypothetical protein